MENEPEAVNSNNGKKTSIYYSWRGNLATNLPIIFAILGFVLAIIILNPVDGHDEYAYHDLQLTNKRQLVNNLLEKRMTRVEATIRDSAQLKGDTLKRLKTFLGISEAEKNNLHYFNLDTQPNYFARFFSADRSQYRMAIDSLATRDSYKVYISLRDSIPLLSSFPYLYGDSLTIKKEKMALISFMEKYPAFGLWFVFSIAQMTLWFLLVALVVGAIQTADLVEPKFSWSHGLFFSILPFLIIGLFVWLIYWKIIDTYVIEDFYFLDAYNAKMLGYAIPGYLVSILCFCGYLFLSNKLELLDKRARTNSLTLATDPELVKKYNVLKSAFNLTFLFTAIILSVFVLWMGILFYGVNGIEAMSYYTSLSGKPFIPYDFVYLVGIIHTLLLLIFYIPVRLRFNSLELKQENDALNNPGNSQKYLKTFWDILSAVLVTTSPLLTTFVQKIIMNWIQ
jgi:hypothetical protein